MGISGRLNNDAAQMQGGRKWHDAFNPLTVDRRRRRTRVDRPADKYHWTKGRLALQTATNALVVYRSAFPGPPLQRKSASGIDRSPLEPTFDKNEI